jgi:hypothetical protein
MCVVDGVVGGHMPPPPTTMSLGTIIGIAVGAIVALLYVLDVLLFVCTCCWPVGDDLFSFDPLMFFVHFLISGC